MAKKVETTRRPDKPKVKLVLPTMTDIVDSSQIAQMGYENGKLFVRFLKEGTLYYYSNVPEKMFDNFMSINSANKETTTNKVSIGSLFHQMVKANADKFPATKLKEV